MLRRRTYYHQNRVNSEEKAIKTKQEEEKETSVQSQSQDQDKSQDKSQLPVACQPIQEKNCSIQYQYQRQCHQKRIQESIGVKRCYQYIQQGFPDINPIQREIDPSTIDPDYTQEKEKEKEKKQNKLKKEKDEYQDDPEEDQGPIIVTQEMLDRYEIEQEGFSLPEPIANPFLIGMFTKEIVNAVPEMTQVDSAPLAWNGITRILISPTSTSGTYLRNGNETSIYGSQTTITRFQVTTNPIVIAENKEVRTGSLPSGMSPESYVTTQGISYVISVLTGEALKKEIEQTFENEQTRTMSGRSLYSAIINEEGEIAEQNASVLPQPTENYTQQYIGTYAIQSPEGSKVESINEGCLITSPVNQVVQITFTNVTTKDEDEDISITSELISNRMIPIGTKEEIIAGTGGIPIIGMIRIDLPEDLIGNVYSYGTVNSITSLGTMNASFTGGVQIGIE